MITTYSAIIATTPITIRYSILFTSILFGQILTWCAISLFVLRAGYTRVTPAITSAAVSVILRSNIAFCDNRNVTRVLARWIYALGNVTTSVEILADRENQICFHKRFLFSIASYGSPRRCTLRGLAFALQKLSEAGLLTIRVRRATSLVSAELGSL